MASTIKLKNGSGAPTTGDLVQGEPALDLTNKRLYTENASGVVIEVGVNPTSITTGNITANGTINLTGATVSNAGSITTADINGGTIDGTVIGGTTAAAITGTTITGTSFVSSGDMTFEDNDKAVFGDGSDLRIYHTGSHSTIENIGTGHLQIHTTDFRLRNSAGTESMILANADGNVQLFYDNAEKLATTATGIDVTGTVTMDGLTVDGAALVRSGNTLTLNRTDNAIGGAMSYVAGTGFIFNDVNGDGTSFNVGAANRLRIDSNGDISFYEDTGTTAKLFWDASEERLGIGTTSPSVHLDVEGTAQVNLLDVTHDGDRAVNFVKTGANTFSIEHDVNQFYFWNQTTSESPLLFQNDGDVIMNGGNVGIGTSSPASALDIIGANQDAIKIRSNVAPENYYQIGRNQSTGLLEFKGSETTYNGYLFKGPSSDLMTINSSGNVGIGTSSPVASLDVVAGADDRLLVTNSSGDTFLSSVNAANTAYNGLALNGSEVKLFTNASERMRIDSSGNLLVGKTATNSATAGAEVRATGALLSAVTSNFCGFFNRISTDGTIIEFAKNDTTVGSIGTRASLLKIGTGDVGLLFNSSSDAILPENIDGGAGRDAAIDLGVAGAKFKDLYLSGGVYLGGTGAANLLDDYEEGTWTGTLTGSTSAPSTAITATGTYTKIGRSVTAVIAFSNKDSTGVAGNIIITGLPFTAAAGGVGAGWHSRSNTGTGTTNGVMSYIASNNDLVLVQGLGSAITWATTGTGTYAGYSITYEV
jgi:hypothetical protein